MPKQEYLALLNAPSAKTLKSIPAENYVSAYQHYLAQMPKLYPQVKATFLTQCIKNKVQIQLKDWEWLLDSSAYAFNNNFKDHTIPLIDVLVEIVKEPDFELHVMDNLLLDKIVLNHNTLPNAVKLLNQLYDSHPEYEHKYLFGKRLTRRMMTPNIDNSELQQNIKKLRSFVDNMAGRITLQHRDLVHTSIQLVDTFDIYKNTPAYQQMLAYIVKEDLIVLERFFTETTTILNIYSPHVVTIDHSTDSASYLKTINRIKATGSEILMSKDDWIIFCKNIINEDKSAAVGNLYNSFEILSVKHPDYIECLDITIRLIAENINPQNSALVDVMAVVSKAFEKVYACYLIDKKDNNLHRNLYNWAEKIDTLVSNYNPIFKNENTFMMVLLRSSLSSSVLDPNINLTNVLDDLLQAYIVHKPELTSVVSAVNSLCLNNYEKIITVVNAWKTKDAEISKVELPTLS